MAIYPGSKYRPVVGLDRDPPIRPIGVILHVAASNADSLYNWFNGPSGGVESHFQIPLHDRAPIEQYRDTTREADANYKGNSWLTASGRLGFISVESAGLADGEWNDSQMRRILALLRWASLTHGFPLTKCRTYRSPGLGYHVMFGTGAGTNSWSNAAGKVCPGRRRITQFENVILPLVQRPITPAPQPPPEDDMFTDTDRRTMQTMADTIKRMEAQQPRLVRIRGRAEVYVVSGVATLRQHVRDGNRLNEILPRFPYGVEEEPLEWILDIPLLGDESPDLIRDGLARSNP